MCPQKLKHEKTPPSYKEKSIKNPSVLFHVPMRVWILILKEINK